MWLLWSLPKIIQKAMQAQSDAFRDVRLKELTQLDKAIALLAVGDPLSYQQVQAMSVTPQYTEAYDPSPEGELQRIHDREGERDLQEEQLTDDEGRFLDDFFPGSGFAGNSGQ